MNSVEDLHKVWETKALKKPGEDKAKKLLDRIAKQVQPIMRKHKWRVKLLSEFWYLFIYFYYDQVCIFISCLVAQKVDERKKRKKMNFFNF